jgi:hypothetical protein
MMKVEVPTHPLPRQRGLSWSTNKWGLDNRHGHNAMNTVRPEMRTTYNRYSGFRLVRDTVTEEP